MKTLKSENGAITILVLVSVLFMVSFLISSYVIIANKVQAQKEVIQETRRIYESGKSLEEIYNSYFNVENIIPIYTVEQLMMMGEGALNVNIDGKYYNFENNENTIYVLMNNIEFNAIDYEQNETIDKWKYVNFHGNGNTITVTYIDNDNEEYEIVYLAQNNYQEPEYEVKVNILNDFGEDITELASVYLQNDNMLEDITRNDNGEYILNIKRLEQTTIVAKLDGYNDATETVYFENPNKIDNEINMVLGQYLFTIVPTPSNAIVKIDGQVRNSISVAKGTTVSWSVELNEYTTKTGTYTVENNNESLEVSLNVITYTYTLNINVSGATVTLNNTTHTDYAKQKVSETQYKILAQKGDIITYSIAKDYYISQSGNTTITEDGSKTVNLSINQSSTSKKISDKMSASTYKKSETINLPENSKILSVTSSGTLDNGVANVQNGFNVSTKSGTRLIYIDLSSKAKNKRSVNGSYSSSVDNAPVTNGLTINYEKGGWVTVCTVDISVSVTYAIK